MADRVIIAGWEVPGLFMYGGLGKFIEGLATGFRELGYKVVLIGMSPVDWFEGCYETGDITICNCRCREPGSPLCIETESICVERLCSVLGSGASLAIINDYHVAGCVRNLAVRKTPTIYYVHAVAGRPAELEAITFSKGVAVASNIMAKNIEPLIQIAFSNFSRWVREIGLNTPMKPAIIRPAPTLEPGFCGDPWPQRQKPPHERGIPLVPRNVLEKTSHVILYMGRLSWEKNLARLAEAIRILNNSGVKVLGIVATPDASSGWLYDGVMYSVGWVDGDIKKKLLCSVDAAVVPSLFESFSLFALEAAAAELPLALTSQSGAAEVLPAYQFNPTSTEDMARAIREALDGGEIAGRRLIKAEIMKRKWIDVAHEIIELAGRESR